jgi:signal peptidase I
MQTLGLSDSTPKPTSRIKELFWPKIDDEVAAVTAARNAMYASFAIAAGTALAAFAAGSYLAWIDVALYVMVGIGVRQLSRTAALTGFILYGLSWLLVPSSMLSGAIVVRLILTALLLNGIRAAAYAHLAHKEHAIEAVANPAVDTTGQSRASVAVENLPNRLWPILKGPFFVSLYALVVLNLWSLSLMTIVQQWLNPVGSMEKTLLVGDRLVSLRRIWMGEVQRGDILVFRFPPSPGQVIIKRVIGVSGDRIKIANKALYLNGAKVAEPYAEHVTDYIDSYRDNFPSQEPAPNLYPGAAQMLRDSVRDAEVVVPTGRYFVLGDNRDQSLDSRYWGFLPDQNVLGRLILVTYSYDKDVRRQGRAMLWLPRISLERAP